MFCVCVRARACVRVHNQFHLHENKSLTARGLIFIDVHVLMLKLIQVTLTIIVFFKSLFCNSP
jgi:hypothetical protein